MKRLVNILMVFWMASCHSAIIEVSQIDAVFDALAQSDSKTLVIFDVDMVLVQPSDPAFQMANMKRYSSIVKRFMQQVPLDKQMLFLSLMTISSEPVLIDERIPDFIVSLQQKAIPVMALTANLTGQFAWIENMEKWRLNNLKRVGIDFSKSAPYRSSIVFEELAPYRSNYSTYVDGMLFVNGKAVSKGEALTSFLQKSQFSPDKIIFIDDRHENLKSLESAIEFYDGPVDYLGIHFKGAEKYPSKVISEADFESAWLKLSSEAIKLNQIRE